MNRGKAGDGSYPFTKRLDGGNWTGTFTFGNINNEAPDMTQPNEAYWAHLDGILTYAQSKGILCLLFPAYVGNGFDIDQGWGPIIAANGGTKMTTYGAWIANRYKSYPNIVWMLGGDEQNFSGANLTAELGLLTGLQSISGQASTNFSRRVGRRLDLHLADGRDAQGRRYPSGRLHMELGVAVVPERVRRDPRDACFPPRRTL